MHTFKLTCFVPHIITAGRYGDCVEWRWGNVLNQPEEDIFPCAPFSVAVIFQQWNSINRDSSLSNWRKRSCHFKFSASNWHFIIYVFHVIMLDNITNDAIRSTGNLKWCTPVLTWERSNSSYATSPAENQQYTKPLHGTMLPDWQIGQVGEHEINSFNLLWWAPDLSFYKGEFFFY